MSSAPGCDRCRELQVEWEIRSPGELEKAIRVIGGYLDRGDLNEVTVPRGFDILRAGGPRPDHVDLAFRCARCACSFTLTVETYHGRGGRWKPQP